MLTPIFPSYLLLHTHISLSLDFCMCLESKEYINSAIFLAKFHWLINSVIQQTCVRPALCLDHSARVREKKNYEIEETRLKFFFF